MKLIVFSLVSMLVLALVFCVPLLHSGVLAGHDIGAHTLRLEQFVQALSQGQFPVRMIEWRIPGNNQPLFSYYPVLFYYLASLPVLLGANLQIGLYFVICLSVLIFVLGWWLLGGEIVAALLLFFPYHISQLYVRSALGEFLAVAFVPWVLWALGRLLYHRGRQGSCLILALSLGAMVLSHQPTAFMLLPVILMLVGTHYFLGRHVGNLRWLIAAIVLGMGISAFFWLPQIAEQNLIHRELLSSNYYDYHLHFVSLRQLIVPSWGYGLSLPGENDGMSFQIGIAPIVALLGVCLWACKRKSRILPIMLGGFIFFLAVFMMLPSSRAIWERFEAILIFLQYPWRFLVLVSVGLAMMLIGVKTPLKQLDWLWKFLVLILIVLPVLTYLRPSRYLELATLTQSQDQALGFEPGYLPASVAKPEVQNVPLVQILSGDTQYKVSSQDMRRYQFFFQSQQGAKVQIGLHDFAGLVSSHPFERNEQGYLLIQLPAGKSEVWLVYADTPIRIIANSISLISLLVVGVMWVVQARDYWRQNQKQKVIADLLDSR